MAGRTFILLAVFTLTTHHVHSQFYDILQGFQPYIQNLQTGRPEYNIYTQAFSQKRPKFDSFIRDDDSTSEERRPHISIITNDRNSKETFRSTTKSSRRRKSTTPAQIFNLNIFATPKPVKKNKNNSSHRNSTSSKVNKNQALTSNNNRRQYYDDSANNVADYNSRPNVVTTKPVYTITRTTARPDYANVRPTATSRPNYLTTKNYYVNNRPEYNTYTTQNPLYNRPGVKPAVVNSNQPPITNRPATTRPDIYRPETNIHSRPDNSRPADKRPEVSRPTASRPDVYRPAPVNTRPFAVYPKPTDSSAIRYPEEPDTSPESIVGPDEDKMSNVEKRRYIDIAERMCDKYKALNVKKVEAIPLVPSPEPVRVNVSVCQPTNVPLVVGGKVVTIEEFPHMALLGWTRLQGGGYSWKCGGSLISDQYVLTAGHCAYQEKDDTVVVGAPRVVQLGSSYLDDTGALVMKVLSVVMHPKYIQTRSYYDVALVKMVKPVSFSQVVKPACLGVPPGVGEPIIATGWGRTEFGGTQSLELRSVSVPIWDINDCRRVLGTSRKLPDGPSTDSQICAGEKNGGKDTCQGDSGGPAQIQDSCSWRVVAVTSVGRSCGAPNTPALYATLHRAFIAAQVFGKTNPASTNQNTASNSENNYNDNRNDKNYQNPRPITANNNWDDNNRRNENNNNGNTHNQNPWNNFGNKNNENSGTVNNNQNWNTNQPSDNKNNNNQKWNENRQNQNNNGNTNGNYENNPNNNGYVVTESNVNYGNNNRQHNNDRQNSDNENHRTGNNDHRIVFQQDNTNDHKNINTNNYGSFSYTTHTPSYNEGWWSNFGY